MELDFYRITRAPQRLPIWQLILADLGNPHPKEIAKVLGVGVRTVYRWNRTGSAPRAAALALYWLTRWGHSEIHTQATNDAALLGQLAASLQRELVSLRVELAEVLAMPRSSSDVSRIEG
jgi:predicted DNA-binding transcriptional regulator AlpA